MSEHESPPLLRDEDPTEVQRRIHGTKEDELNEVYIEAIEAELAKDAPAEKLSELYASFVKNPGVTDATNVTSKQRTGRERDQQEYVFVRIDRKKKLHVTHMLRALNLSDQEILDEFFDTDTFMIDNQGQIRYSSLDPDRLLGENAKVDIKDDDGNLICAVGDRINRRDVRLMHSMSAKARQLAVPDSFFEGVVLAKDIGNIETAEVIMPCNTVLNIELVNRLRNLGIDRFETLAINELTKRSFIADTLRRDPDTEPNNTRQRSLIEIYNVMRPGEPVTLESAETLFERTFFSQERYELSEVGRMKFNRRLAWEE